MAKERRKVIRAGDLWMAVQYIDIKGDDRPAQRLPKSRPSSMAREYLNFCYSYQKLMLLLCSNFKKRDLVVTLSYRDASLPPRREDADRILGNFIRALRKYRTARGQPLVYIRVTEGFHGDGRLHHHLIINTTGHDYKVIRRLWKKHGDDVDFQYFGGDGPLRWARYLTKETKERGRKYVGDRIWRSSIRMLKPAIYSEWVPEGEKLTAPPGSFILDTDERNNTFGHFCYVEARLSKKQRINIESGLG